MEGEISHSLRQLYERCYIYNADKILIYRQCMSKLIRANFKTRDSTITKLLYLMQSHAEIHDAQFTRAVCTSLFVFVFLLRTNLFH